MFLTKPKLLANSSMLNSRDGKTGFCFNAIMVALLASNDCAIALPDTPPLPPLHLQQMKEAQMDGLLEDASDRDRQVQMQVEKQKGLEFKRQSQVIQKNLSRPSVINNHMDLNFIEFHDKSPNYVKAGEMIRNEMLLMMEYDNERFERDKADESGKPLQKNKKKKKKINEVDHIFR